MLKQNLDQEPQKGSPLSVLEVQDFRNLGFHRIIAHPRFNFFFGDNAQGKTSILEALYFISELKSFRSQDLAPLVQHDKEAAFLRADLQFHGLAYDLKASISEGSKEVYLNGKKPRPYSKLRQVLPVVLFTPDSIRLFRGSPGERRGYFDRSFSLLSEDYENALEHYQSVLKHKQSLIDQARETGYWPADQVEIWNHKLAVWGAKLSYLRFQWTRKMSLELAAYFARLSAGDWKVSLEYEPYVAGITQDLSEMEIEAKLSSEIRERARDELDRGQCLVGPHRDDFVLWLDGQRLKEEGSQGQHRVSVAALKLSEVALIQASGKVPLALFDDLLSELDLQRSRRMLETLSECECQVFLTSVTPLGVPLKGLEGVAYELKKGLLCPAEL